MTGGAHGGWAGKGRWVVTASTEELVVRVTRLEEQSAAAEKATQLQAGEYKRRLHDLNGEYKRDRERQQDFVSMDKYEDKIAAMDEARITAVQAEKDAREAALLRVDEKLQEYVRKWEQVQSEQAAKLVTLEAAAAEAKRIAEDQGRLTRDEADRNQRQTKAEQEAAARKQSVQLTKAGLGLALFLGFISAYGNGLFG